MSLPAFAMNIISASWQSFNDERSFSSVPRWVLICLLLALILQIAWHYQMPEPKARASSMSSPPHESILGLSGFGDQVALSKFVMLSLQAFDNQPGLSIPFKQLDYQKVVAWLRQVAKLDSRSRYPYLAAARIYAEVQDNEKRRVMLEFVREGFLRDPARQWPAMAHAVFVAKHRMKDLEFALELARDIRLHLVDLEVPSWVRQMELFVLEEMGDLESAQVLLGGFLDSGIIRDDKEYRFLRERLGVGQTE